MAIEVALEACRDNESGYGPQKLAALAAYALRTGLLSFLTTVQVRPKLGASATRPTMCRRSGYRGRECIALQTYDGPNACQICMLCGFGHLNIFALSNCVVAEY